MFMIAPSFAQTVQPIALRPACAAIAGDTIVMAADRFEIEIVIGFRPGIDRLLILAAPGVRGAERLLTTEEAGNAVVVDGLRRSIVLEGVALADVRRGDIELGRSA